MTGITDFHLTSNAAIALIALAIVGAVTILTIAAWQLTPQYQSALDVFALFTTAAVVVMFLWP
jgi:hypothetical protein